MNLDINITTLPGHATSIFNMAFSSKLGFRKFLTGSLLAGLLGLPAAAALAHDDSGLAHGDNGLAHDEIGLAHDDFSIRLENGSVWLDADNANLQQVLQHLAHEGGFKLWISGKLETRQVSIRIEDKSMIQALDLLLEDIAHALVRDDNSMVTGLYVLPTGEAQASHELPSSDNTLSRIEAIRSALQSSPLSGVTQETLTNQLGNINVPVTEHEGHALTQEQSEALQAITEKLQQLVSSDNEEFAERLQQLQVDTSQQSR